MQRGETEIGCSKITTGQKLESLMFGHNINVDVINPKLFPLSIKYSDQYARSGDNSSVESPSG